MEVKILFFPLCLFQDLHIVLFYKYSLVGIWIKNKYYFFYIFIVDLAIFLVIFETDYLFINFLPIRMAYKLSFFLPFVIFTSLGSD